MQPWGARHALRAVTLTAFDTANASLNQIQIVALADFGSGGHAAKGHIECCMPLSLDINMMWQQWIVSES